MTRNISFSMTTEQFRRSTPEDIWKDVTRRDGWWDLKPGDVLMGCVRCMGLKKGERIEKMHPIRILSTRPEPLRALLDDAEYGRSEMVREGFPDKTPAEFCELYIAHNGGDLDTLRNRIEFEHLDEVTT